MCFIDWVNFENVKQVVFIGDRFKNSGYNKFIIPKPEDVFYRLGEF